MDVLKNEYLKTRVIQDTSLDEYRAKANFDVRFMKSFMFGEDVLNYQAKIYKVLGDHEIFHKVPFNLPLEKQRDLTLERFRALNRLGVFDRDEMMADPWKHQALLDCLYAYDPSLAISVSVHYYVFYYAAAFLGTDRHWKILESCENLEVIGCYALTELAHGSNVQSLETTLTFDETAGDFILNTPRIEAAKVWSGNLGSFATHAVVFARLITGKPKKDYGLHAVLIQIRCVKTMQPVQGVVLGDMGEKVGVNGLSNGFAVFKSMRVPRHCLLNKSADVDQFGNYISSKDPKRGSNSSSNNTSHASNFGSLSMGRIGIICNATQFLRITIPISIRYSACRRQFCSPGCKEELPIIEYPLHQFRLMPYLAATVVLTKGFQRLQQEYSNFIIRSTLESKSSSLNDLSRELHALSCCGKSLATWISMNAVQESRQACGGHGYLKASRLGDIRADCDPSLTFEGDNNVLLQQTANYLHSFALENGGDGIYKSPLSTVDFLQNMGRILARPIGENAIILGNCTEEAISAYQFLCSYLFQRSLKAIKDAVNRQSATLFDARNSAQVYLCHTLSLVFMELTLICWFLDAVKAAPADIKKVLQKAIDLYALWSLDNRLASLYISGYCKGSSFGNFVRSNIVRLCKELKTEAVLFCDILAPPDHILDSVLGKSDGQLYDNLFSTFICPTQASQPLHSWTSGNLTKHLSKL